MYDSIGKKIAVIGLGYVGLPLAVEFGQKYKTLGFDINIDRINELKSYRDHTLEISDSYLCKTFNGGLFEVSNDIEKLSDCNIYIITVPTPIDKYNRPDLTPLIKASKTVGSVLKEGDIVIYESTVYPGVTEDDCVPILEKVSKLTFNKDFFVGYSPERINPGDKEHTLTKILKVTSGSTPEIAEIVDSLYKSIIVAGTHKAPSIKVAEAAKVIENTQRDINIAFVNELAKIFSRMGLDTHDVLSAAGTKWNFLNFKPGLVGGHCIGVDPYYLSQKAQELGYHPEIILAGRRLNDGMGHYVAQELIKLMIAREIKVKNSKVLILGFTFKENCTDVRNTRVIDIINELQSYQIETCIYDPWASEAEVKQEYGFELCKELGNEEFDAILLAVAHEEFRMLDLNVYRKAHTVIYDLKGFLPVSVVDLRL